MPACDVCEVCGRPARGRCERCHRRACADCGRCYGCGRILCDACDAPGTPRHAAPGDRYYHPHSEPLEIIP